MYPYMNEDVAFERLKDLSGRWRTAAWPPIRL
jgi:hypothetical protein